jgi:hypothetical protein
MRRAQVPFGISNSASRDSSLIGASAAQVIGTSEIAAAANASIRCFRTAFTSRAEP